MCYRRHGCHDLGRGLGRCLGDVGYHHQKQLQPHLPLSDLIVLVGLPGSGKSSVGRQLARRLRTSFQDSDHVIEQRLRCSIRDFFALEGEEAFRDIEQNVLGELLEATQGVLATGGGAVMRQANRDRIRGLGNVVYLRSTPEEIFRRVRHDSNRPLLQVADPLQRLRELYSERDPLYLETAQVVVDTGRPTIAALVNTIISRLGRDPQQPS